MRMRQAVGVEAKKLGFGFLPYSGGHDTHTEGSSGGGGAVQCREKEEVVWLNGMGWKASGWACLKSGMAQKDFI